jgi:uncharacterized protein (TIGR03086 family)
MDELNPVELFEQAATRAAGVMAAVSPARLGDPTPCAEWTVQQLIDHIVGGPGYLTAALAGVAPPMHAGCTADDYSRAIEHLGTGLRAPGALDRTCASPLGFDWSVGQATAGTFMDTLIHTWDLATATDQDATLDPALVDACVAMFLPDMPERGRTGGLVGPAVDVAADASPQDRLLAAMGRRP